MALSDRRLITDTDILTALADNAPSFCRRSTYPAAQHTGCRQIPYTEGVEAHWMEAKVGEHGELVLENVPFKPGQPVEVLVLSRTAPSLAGQSRILRDSVLEYRDPFEPVASEEWEALR